jgi:hypothetical protein
MIQFVDVHGGRTGSAALTPRSRLYDYVEMTASSQPHPEPEQDPEPDLDPVSDADAADAVARRRREFAVLLGEFRRTAVLVPLGDGPGTDAERRLLTAD